MDKYLIVVGFNGRFHENSDYIIRLAQEFTKDHLVVGMLLNAEPNFIWRRFLFRSQPKIIFRNRGVFFVRALYLLPFQRFYIIRLANWLIFSYLCFPFILRWIVWKQRLRTYRNIFIFYDPDKAPFYFPHYFRILFSSLARNFITIFDIVDYPPVHQNSRAMEVYKTYIKLAKIVVVNSRTLYEVFRPIRSDILVVPLGFAQEVFDNPLPMAKIIKNKPLIGFVGAFGTRIDFRLLFRLIEKNLQWRFIFWRPVQIERGENKKQVLDLWTRFKEFPNVVVGYSPNKREIPSIIKQFDIGIIPYSTNKIKNRLCYPMKLFEYFYMGKPVITTQIEELKRFPKYVKIGNTVEEWEEQMKILFDKPWPKVYQKLQRRLAVENSWKKK